MSRLFWTALACLMVVAVGPLAALGHAVPAPGPVAPALDPAPDGSHAFSLAPALDPASDGSHAFSPAPTGYAAPAEHPPTRQAEDVVLNLTDFSSAFGAEEYKYGHLASTRDANAAENQTTVWETALGHSVTFTIRVQDGDSTITCDQVLIPEAYIATSAGRLHGFLPGSYDPAAFPCTSGLPATRTWPLTFDVDGTPPTVSGFESPALLPGVYGVVFNVYYQVARTSANPGGIGPLAGSTRVDFALATPQITPLETPLRFPESTLRLFSDVGASFASAYEYVMLPGPLRTSGETNVTVAFPGVAPGTTFERIDHSATRAGSDVSPPVAVPGLVAGATPLDEAAEKATSVEDRATVTVTPVRPTLSDNKVPAARAVNMPIRGADFPVQSGPTVTAAYVPLQVVTIHVPGSRETMTTGATSIVVPVSDNDYPIRGIDSTTRIPGIGQTGVTTVRIRDATETSGGPTGQNAGDLFALRPIGFGNDLMASARLTRQSDDQWVSGEFNHLAFADPVSNYRMLAMVYGAQDEFYGLTMATRGIGIEVGPLRIVEETTGRLLVTLRNLADDGDGQLGESDFALAVTLTGSGFPDGEPYNRTLLDPIPEGGAVVVDVPVVGTSPNTYNVVFTARSGELIATQDTTVEVISKERAREEDRKWYSVPGPELALMLGSLVLVAVVARRRA